MPASRAFLLLFLIQLASAAVAPPASPEAGFDEAGRFTVTAAVSEGARHAVLEISADLSAASSWRRMLAASTDGRAAWVTFRLPPSAGGQLFARVATGPAAEPPPVELADPSLVSVSYFGSITSEVKFAVLAEGAAKLGEYVALPRAEAETRLVDWARHQPAIEHAAASPLGGGITLRFKDGDESLLLHKRRSSRDASSWSTPAGATTESATRRLPPLPSVVKSTSSSSETAIIGGLPQSNAAVCAFSLEPEQFPNSAPTIAGWLRSENYPTRTFAATTIDDLLGWSAAEPLGVLYWQVHGCDYEKKNGSAGLALVTRQFATHELETGRYAEMRRRGELMLAGYVDQSPPFYTVTSKFVRKYLRFAPHSLVVLDSCNAALPELAQAFHEAGAGSYAAWDWLSGDASGTPCLKVFDRLLGKNAEPPISTPKERPFALQPIRWWMTNMSYDIDPSPQYTGQTRRNARLTWSHHPRTPANILRPCLMRVLHEAPNTTERFHKYLIEGDFGPDPGPSRRVVRWGGVDMPVERWHPANGIVIRIPHTPPQGEMQVSLRSSYNVFHSNKVPITEWTLPITYTVASQGSLQATMELTLKFRGDIHGARGMPEMEPQYLAVPFVNAGDCAGTLTASGRHDDSDSRWITWSGGSALTSFDPATRDPQPIHRHIFHHGTIHPATGLLQPFEFSATADFTETTYTRHPDGSVTENGQHPSLGLVALPWMLTGPLSFDPASGRIPARRQTIGSATLSWPSVTPKNFPVPADLR